MHFRFCMWPVLVPFRGWKKLGPRPFLVPLRGQNRNSREASPIILYGSPPKPPPPPPPSSKQPAFEVPQLHLAPRQTHRTSEYGNCCSNTCIPTLRRQLMCRMWRHGAWGWGVCDAVPTPHLVSGMGPMVWHTSQLSEHWVSCGVLNGPYGMTHITTEWTLSVMWCPEWALWYDTHSNWVNIECHVVSWMGPMVWHT